MTKMEKHKDGQLPTRLELAVHLHQQVILGVFVTAQAIKRIRDEQLYKELGCDSFREYIETMTPVSRSQAYLCIKVIERFDRLIPQKLQKNNGVQLLDNQFQDFAIWKLGEIANLNDPDLKELLDGGRVKVGDRDFDLESLASVKQVELQETMKKYKRDHRALTAKLDETNKKLESENKAKDKKIDELKKLLEDYKELEYRFGPGGWKLSDRRHMLELIRAALYTANGLVVKMDIKEDDPAEFREQVLEFVRYIDMIHKNLANKYSGLIS